MRHFLAPARLISLTGLFVIAGACAAQPAEVVASLRRSFSEVPSPSKILGIFDDSGFPLQATFGPSNSNTKESGFSLQQYFELPFTRERVWAFDLTDPMPLVFTQESWVRGDQTPRTVRMYFHVGFDAAGKAVAAAQWFKGPSGARAGRNGGSASGARLNQSAQGSVPAYWNYCFPAMLERYVQPDKTQTTFWTPKDGPTVGQGARAHKCPSGKGGCMVCGLQVPDRLTASGRRDLIGILLPARDARGTYPPRGLVMGHGAGRQGNGWAVVGEAWATAVGKPGENGNPPPFWVLEQPGRTAKDKWLVCDLRLVIEWTNDSSLALNKVLLTTNAQAPRREGVN
jgi:hypothetical protein